MSSLFSKTSLYVNLAPVATYTTCSHPSTSRPLWRLKLISQNFALRKWFEGSRQAGSLPPFSTSTAVGSLIVISSLFLVIHKIMTIRLVPPPQAMTPAVARRPDHKLQLMLVLASTLVPTCISTHPTTQVLNLDFMLHPAKMQDFTAKVQLTICASFLSTKYIQTMLTLQARHWCVLSRPFGAQHSTVVWTYSRSGPCCSNPFQTWSPVRIHLHTCRGIAAPRWYGIAFRGHPQQWGTGD